MNPKLSDRKCRMCGKKVILISEHERLIKENDKEWETLITSFLKAKNEQNNT